MPPVWVPPPVNESVPDWPSIVPPVLLNISTMVEVPAPADLRKVPVLLKVPVPVALQLMVLLLCISKRAPLRLFRTAGLLI